MIYNAEVLRGLVNISFGGVVKWLVVGGLLMYVAFALVVVKQVGVMTESVESDVNPVVKALSWIHLVAALVLLAAGVYIL